jgi:hypothetical protein
MKAKIEKYFQSVQVTINAELYSLLLATRLKRETMEFGATLGPNVPALMNILIVIFQHLLVTWVQTTSQKCSKLAPGFFSYS